jgi:bacterioferritin (cytochrome b1)
VKPHSKIISLLNQLLELEYGSLDAYRAAMQRLGSHESRSVLASFCEERERHARELDQSVLGLGGAPAMRPPASRARTHARVAFAGEVRGDRDVLERVRAQAAISRLAYERAAKLYGLGPRLRQLARRHLAAERRHRAWLHGRLDEDTGRSERSSRRLGLPVRRDPRIAEGEFGARCAMPPVCRHDDASG